MTKKNIYLFLALSIALYLILTFAIPPDPRALALYKTTANALRLKSLPLTVSIIVIWSLAFYGFAQFKEYARKIRKSADGKALNDIANGLGVLALTMPITSMLSSLSSYYVRSHPEFLQTSILIRSYLSLVIYLVTFWLVAKGAKKLLKIVKHELEIGDQVISLFAFVLAGGLYAFLAVKSLQAPPSPRPSGLLDVLSTPVALLTVILPYLLIWLTGIWAVSKISLYHLLVQGTIYRKALSNLSAGLALIVVTSVLVQGLGTVSTTLLKLSLNQLFLLIYGLLAVIGAGFVIIALGAKKLSKLEEV